MQVTRVEYTGNLHVDNAADVFLLCTARLEISYTLMNLQEDAFHQLKLLQRDFLCDLVQDHLARSGYIIEFTSH